MVTLTSFVSILNSSSAPPADQLAELSVLLEHGINQTLHVVGYRGAQHEMGVRNQVVVEAHRGQAHHQSQESAWPYDVQNVDARGLDGDDLVIMRQPSIDDATGEEC